MAVGLEQNTYSILAVADARVYHAMLDPKDGPWTYSGWKGRMIFGQDLEVPHSNDQDINETQKLWFRLVDDETGTTIWTFKFPEKLEYTEERPFFHVFKARVRRYGLLFNDDGEATAFGQKVVQCLGGHQHARLMRAPSRAGTHKSKSNSYSMSRSMISSPPPQAFKNLPLSSANKHRDI
ncbi:hypothetical protein CVT26_006664 [Gymnopilus dilepis]|uniref:WH1 domain-containing protein n=1 Tax=Gymnopilus dilepis TaxID=231916 RepID=A0A409Y2U3_9AGAR|nr:hypothetical protein CVT26_006664 [Gymnopilus dilepis]